MTKLLDRTRHAALGMPVAPAAPAGGGSGRSGIARANGMPRRRLDIANPAFALVG